MMVSRWSAIGACLAIRLSFYLASSRGIEPMISYNFVTGRLATGGGIGTEDDIQVLVKSGVTHIIDCTELDDAASFQMTPFAYLWNGTADDGQPKPPEWFARSVTFALEALRSPGHRVYAHCAAGMNRGPSTAYAILRAFGLTAAWAESCVREARPQVGLRYKADADRAITALGYGGMVYSCYQERLG